MYDDSALSFFLWFRKFSHPMEGFKPSPFPFVTDRLGLLILRDFRLRLAPSQPFVSLL